MAMYHIQIVLLIFVVSNLFQNCVIQCQGFSIQGHWVANHRQPTSRVHAAITCDDHGMYVLGGEDEEHHVLDDFWVYDSWKKHWYQIFPAGHGNRRKDAKLAIAQGAFFLDGGVDENDNLVETSVEHVHHQQSWEPVHFVGEFPALRKKHSIIGHHSDGYFSLFGIGEHALFNDVWYYNSTEHTWHELHEAELGHYGAHIPAGRHSACCDTTHEDHVICFGGSTQHDDNAELWMFFHSNHTWDLIDNGNGPSARHGAVCAVHGETFFLGLGETQGEHMLDDMWTWDLLGHQWVSHPKAPFHLGASGGCVLSEFLYVTTGYHDDQMHPDNAMWKMNMTSYIWSQVYEHLTLPAARSSAASVRVNEDLWVFGGLGLDYTTFDDVWTYHLKTKKWSKESAAMHWDVHSDTGYQGGRVGATSQQVGRALWAFGGYYIIPGVETQHFTNDLIQLLIDDRLFHIKHTGKVKPKPRAFACSVFFNNTFIVFGGLDKNHKGLDDLWMYSLYEEEWMPIIVVNYSNTPKKKGGCYLHHLPNGTVVLAGGSTKGEEFWALDVDMHDFPWRAKWRQMIVSYPSHTQEYDFRREKAGFVGVGYHIAVCGGVSDEHYAYYNESDSCFSYNAYNGQITLFQEPRMGYVSKNDTGLRVVSPTAFMHEHSMYFLDGAIATNGILREHIAAIKEQVYVIDENQLCTPYSDYTSCIHCGLGSFLNQTHCVEAPAGMYVGEYGSTPIPCPKGEYSDAIGATQDHSCTPCDEGTYNNETGATKCVPCLHDGDHFCPMRAIVPILEHHEHKAIDQHVESTNQQPLPYAKKPVPQTALYSFLAAVVSVIVCIILLLVIQTIIRYFAKGYFLPPAARQEIHNIYIGIDPHQLGINAQQLLLVLHELDAVNVDDPTALRLLNENDVSGVHLLFEDEVESVVIQCIKEGKLPPFRGSQAVVDGVTGGIKEKIASIRIWKLDTFSAAHVLAAAGNPIRIKKNLAGGIGTIFFVLASLVAVILLTLAFQYENIFEVRSTVPRVVVTEYISTNIRVVATTHGDTNWQNCVASSRNRAVVGDCLHTTVHHTGIVVGGEEGLHCTFVDPRNCTVEWMCRNCSLKDSDAAIDVVMHQHDWFSDFTEVSLAFYTGIENEDSTARMSFFPPAHYVFKGKPATTMSTELTSTVYSAPESTWQQRFSSQTGFHVRPMVSQSSLGNQVDHWNFGEEFTVPIRVNLAETASTLMVSRIPSVNIEGFVAQLLGSISGVLVLATAFVGIVDAYNLRRVKKRKEELADLAPSSISTSFASLKDIRPLVGAGMTLAEALAVRQLMVKKSGAQNAPKECFRAERVTSISSQGESRQLAYVQSEDGDLSEGAD